jgi:hypothetical protein
MGELLSSTTSPFTVSNIVQGATPVLAPLALIALAFGIGPRIATKVIRTVRGVAK